MKTSARIGLIAALCSGLAGCAAVIPQVAVWVGESFVAGSAAGGVAALADSSLRKAEQERCRELTSKATVTALPGTVIPTDDGEFNVYAPVSRRTQFEGYYFIRVERDGNAVTGTLAITERSLIFVTPEEGAGVRIPFDLVLQVKFLRSINREPRIIIVESVCGRTDTFTFGQAQQPDKVDSEVTAAAVNQLRARVATFHASTPK